MPSRARKAPQQDACALEAPLAPVFDLGVAREKLRLRLYGRRVAAMLERNRRAIQRLFDTGLVFSRHGTRAGRDLLLVQQNLLRVSDLVGGWLRADQSLPPDEIEALFSDIEKLLEKAGELARRHRTLFES